MSFIKELKRRNVIRVAIAYVVVAWLTAQVTELALDSFAAPDWVMKTVLFLLLIGFPLALILAWAYELTPEGLKKEKDVDRSESITHITGRRLDFIIIVVMALAIAYFVYDEFVIEPAQDEALATASHEAAAASEASTIETSIAVLPFVNMSDDPGNEYFSDGLSEEILNLLAKISDLKVIGRTSSFAFKGKNTDLRDIGRALDVKTVLEGSVRKSGNRVRITAQLIDVADGAHIWSETYDRTLNDIFAVQDDVAAAIIDALQIHVGVNPTRGRPTANTEAYALFLKARAAFNAGEWLDAEAILQKTVELDPAFAEAYELLAFDYWYQAGWLVTSAEGQKLASEAAARALTINPDLVLAQALYQTANIETYSYLVALSAFERAAREHPGNPALLEIYLWYTLEAGYLREAVRLAERFVDLEPLLPAANQALADSLYALGRDSEAVAALEVAFQLGSPSAKWVLGDLSLMEKQDDTAIAHFEVSLQQNGLPGNWVRKLVAGARNPTTGQAYLGRRIPEIIATLPEEYAFNMRQNLNQWYVLFGFLDRYFELILDRDITNSEWTDADVPVYAGTVWRRLGFAAHPKYLEVVESMGITAAWEQRGPPDFCEKLDGKWVCE